ncbi:MAG TPA: glycosyltransferase family 4 protein [Candidatus Acidoferrales bacterium]|nr:glycosyltransferase family 4 protein [Candidatus Acidoferrales bacterium]
MAPARVLFVDHAPARGGAENSLLLLLEYLERSRFTPELATQPGTLSDGARALGIVVHELPLQRLYGEPTAAWRLARGATALASIVRNRGISLLHCNTVRASVYAAAAAQLTRRPLVWHVRDILPRGLYTRALCAASTMVIAVSRAAAVPLPCAEKVRVVYNGVRAADFGIERRQPAAALRAAWGIPPDALLIGHVARLQPWKGQHDVVAVAARLARERPNVYFALIGGDIFADASAYERALRAAIAESGVAERIVLTGHQTDIPATLAALDVLVHASRNDPFPRILLEAAAAGLPIVAYGGGGVPEVLSHERTALLVPSEDRRALADALRRLIADPNLRRTLGAAARADISVRFDVRSLTRQIEQVLDHALA